MKLFHEFLFKPFTVFLSYLKRERERFPLFVPKSYCVTTRKFLGILDRSTFLNVTMTVPDRSRPFQERSGFLTVLEINFDPINLVGKVWRRILTKFQIYPTCNYGVRSLGQNPSTRLMPLGCKVNVYGNSSYY